MIHIYLEMQKIYKLIFFWFFFACMKFNVWSWRIIGPIVNKNSLFLRGWNYSAVFNLFFTAKLVTFEISKKFWKLWRFHEGKTNIRGAIILQLQVFQYCYWDKVSEIFKNNCHGTSRDSFFLVKFYWKLCSCEKQLKI